MFLAPNMILVGILAKVGFLADSTTLLERSLVSSGVRTGLCRKNFLVEDFRRYWRKGSDTAFEVVSTTSPSARSSVKGERTESVRKLTASHSSCVHAGLRYFERQRHMNCMCMDASAKDLELHP